MATASTIRQLTMRVGQFFGDRSSAPNGPPDEIFETGDFRIDMQTHRVRVRGQEVSLTADEFELLVFLTGHPKRIVTPRTRLSTRWGNHEVGQADFLRVLTTLRKKLESLENATHYIRTEPWIFYHFDPGQ